MADAGLAERSALAGFLRAGRHGRDGPPGLTLQERTRVDIVTVAGRRGQGAALAEAVREAFGLDLPQTPRRVSHARLAFLWAGNARWTVVSETGGEDLEATLRDRLGRWASITGQRDGRVILRLRGPSSRDLLAKAMTIDLHPRAFRPDDVALSPAFGIAAQLCQRDAEPTYDMLVPSSYAAGLWAWLVAAGEEYGIEVLG